MNNWFCRAWKENRAFLLFMVLMFVFRSSFADWNSVPTGSMNPTIVEGDRILVNKLAYDVRIPFTHISLYQTGNPARGDIIVFDSQVAAKRLVKRVIGIPGDIVELRHNILFLNGQRLAYQDLSSTRFSSDRSEHLPGAEHLVRVSRYVSALSSFGAVTVPAGYYLALGDNRDNSADSRVIGLVPRAEIVGRSRHVVLSFDYENFYVPRSGRFFRSL